MTATRILLTDTASGTWQERFGLRPGDGLRLAGSADWSVRKETLRGGTSDGIDVVTIDNGRLTLSVLPTRGMGVWDAVYRGLRAGWKSPAERPVHPAFVPLESRNGLGWLRGFGELICRCGLTSNGPPGPDPGGNPIESPLPLHGRIANLPAHRVELILDDDGLGTITLAGVVDETTLYGSNLRLTTAISTVAGSDDFVIRDVVTNRGAGPAESQLLYHINVGPPFLERGSRFVVPASEVAPRDARAAEGWETWDACGLPEVGYAEQVYFVRPVSNERGESFVLLRNAGGDKGLSVHFRTDRLPCLSLWKNTAAEADGFVAGLEPATNYPNHRSFERAQGRVVTLGPGESYETFVRVSIHDHLENVAALEAIAAGMTGERPPTVHRSPQAGFSPA
ncbi:MAG TPA: aldose 1-epimerase family protein [Planctomycetaceae bacterium]